MIFRTAQDVEARKQRCDMTDGQLTTGVKSKEAGVARTNPLGQVVRAMAKRRGREAGLGEGSTEPPLLGARCRS
jgi:hypothetical protein